VASIAKRADGKWRARYRDSANREHSRHFTRKVDAQRWLDEVTASVVTGMYVDPQTAKTTVEQWCGTWMAGRSGHRPSTERRVRLQVSKIVAEFGPRPIGSVRPSEVRAWLAGLREVYAPRTVNSIYRTLVQVFSDAVHDGVIAKSPCSRRTSPGSVKQRPYVATTQQVWELHDAMPERLRAAILLGAFVGLRSAEACGLRVADVDFMRGVVHPAVQYPAMPLKSETSRTAVPIPQELALVLSEHMARRPAETILSSDAGGHLTLTALNRSFRQARAKVEGLPEGFRYHDLRHFFASLLIASGADVKVVQTRLRHASAVTTLDTYGHLWPDSDESTRAAVAAVFEERSNDLHTRGVHEA
jgi:integrase